ncbi:UNVERIFIED_CONTAM: Suppressor of G2 allele of SKP1 [Gekko kuhli]
MAEGVASLRLSEGDIGQDPAAAVQKLTVALEEQPDNSGYYCQRAYAHILLQNYHDAVTDAKNSLALDPRNATAFLRQGIGEYHVENYRAAMKSFSEGQKLDNMDEMFAVWIKRCREALDRKSQAEVDPQVLQHSSRPPRFKHDWYQTESHVIVTIMIKNAKKDDVNVQFSEKELGALVRVSPEEDYRLQLHLLHPIVPEQSTFKVLSTKVNF